MRRATITMARGMYLSNLSDAERELAELREEEAEQELDRLKAAKDKKQKQKEQVSFKDLFKSPSDYDNAIKALQSVSPAIIDINCTYCGGKASKSSISAFVDLLIRKAKLSHTPPDSELAQILNIQFPNLNFDKTGRTLRSKGGRAYEKYYPLLDTLIK